MIGAAHRCRRGSDPPVAWSIVRDAGRLTLLGLAIGVPLAFLASRVLSSLMFGISESDVVTFAAVASSSSCWWAWRRESTPATPRREDRSGHRAPLRMMRRRLYIETAERAFELVIPAGRRLRLAERARSDPTARARSDRCRAPAPSARSASASRRSFSAAHASESSAVMRRWRSTRSFSARSFSRRRLSSSSRKGAPPLLKRTAPPACCPSAAALPATESPPAVHP